MGKHLTTQREDIRVANDRKKIRAAKVSVASNSFLVIAKLTAGFYMGSVSVISDGIHSGLDLAAAIIALAAVRQAAKPADRTHRFGHGKYENLAGIAEGFLIFVAAVAIIGNAFPRLFNPVEVEALGLGGVVVGTAILVNTLVSRYLMRVAHETDSPALKADAWHLRSDVYTSVGVLAGLGLIKLTGLAVFDPLVAIAVSLVILRAAYTLIWDSLRSLLDARLPEDDETIIHRVLGGFAPEFANYHALRTRKAGSEQHIDLHIVTASALPVAQAHSLCDRVEREITKVFPNSQVLIHIEPCDDECVVCGQGRTCSYSHIREKGQAGQVETIEFTPGKE
ncbi:MAG: cation diffusion facilitator family transporter [Clostridia bacterium]|nr:cation diffusion facilitator family transporter [Clostridia bacterium]